MAEAVAREMAKAHMHYQALLNDRGATAMLTSLKMTFRALGFKVMDPFDWTKDKTIYQRWQMWSEKARHTLDAMEGDSGKTKISYFHHWIDSEGMAMIESLKNKKILRARREPNREPTLFRAPKMMTLTLMKNTPRVNMLKLVNHIEANRGGKHLKFPIASHPKGPYKHHTVVRVDTGADVNCMNEKTFNELFPEVQLSACPHEIQNFRNSVAAFQYQDNSIPTWSLGVKST